VGFVAAFPYTEVISGYTAFLLGVRSVVENATMEVVYTYAWDNYVLEKDCATLLLDDGCQVISQHTDTVGPAVACEEYYARDVFHVGYNQSMADVAPNTSLASARICWEPYVEGAVRAQLADKPIEDMVGGNIHPKNDVSAGFDLGWVELLGLNEELLPAGSGNRIDGAITEMRQRTNPVFVGDYRGVNPDDPNDVCYLGGGFHENADSSIPSFHYVLDDVITVVDDSRTGIVHGV
jgi:basic membrane protein A